MLGIFNTDIEAAICYDEGCIKYYNKERRFNFPPPEPENNIPNTRLLRLNNGMFAIVDDFNFEKANKYKWFAVKGGGKDGTWYAYRHYYEGEKDKTQSLHRFILGIYDSPVIVDHKDHNGLNNTEKNIRICNHSQNGANRIKEHGFTSIYKGVYLKTNCSNIYVGSLGYNYKMIYLGCSMCQKQLAYKYNEKSLELNKEFAYPNIIKYEFQIS